MICSIVPHQIKPQKTPKNTPGAAAEPSSYFQLTIEICAHNQRPPVTACSRTNSPRARALLREAPFTGSAKTAQQRSRSSANGQVSPAATPGLRDRQPPPPNRRPRDTQLPLTAAATVSSGLRRRPGPHAQPVSLLRARDTTRPFAPTPPGQGPPGRARRAPPARHLRRGREPRQGLTQRRGTGVRRCCQRPGEGGKERGSPLPLPVLALVLLLFAHGGGPGTRPPPQRCPPARAQPRAYGTAAPAARPAPPPPSRPAPRRHATSGGPGSASALWRPLPAGRRSGRRCPAHARGGAGRGSGGEVRRRPPGRERGLRAQ